MLQRTAWLVALLSACGAKTALREGPPRAAMDGATDVGTQDSDAPRDVQPLDQRATPIDVIAIDVGARDAAVEPVRDASVRDAIGRDVTAIEMCARSCLGRECGSERCGGICGSCPDGLFCSADRRCRPCH